MNDDHALKPLLGRVRAGDPEALEMLFGMVRTYLDLPNSKNEAGKTFPPGNAFRLENVGE